MNIEIRTKNNKLLAEFMGWEFGRDKHLPGKCYKGIFNSTEEIAQHLDQMRYDADWNLLMAVILEIGNKTGFTLVMEENTSYWVNSGNYIDDEPEFGGYNNILNIHEACVEFVKWWNNKNV